MFLFLSKFLPLFVYPLGLACGLMVLALLLYRRQSWSRATLILALVLLWLGGNRWVATLLVRSLEWQYLPPAEIPTADVIVVLGGATRLHSFPRPLVEVNEAGDRLLYAAWLYHQGKAEYILLSGGGASALEARGSEAADMAAVIDLLNVPETAVWLESDSLNTYENARNSQQILQPKGMNQILLVTSAVHMPRSMAAFTAQGFEVIPAPTDFWVTEADWASLKKNSLAGHLLNLLPNATYLEWTTRALKEYIGLLVYGVG